MSGSGTTTTTQSLTGNLNIDGLLYGRKWNATSITYSNPDSAVDYQAGYLTDHDGDGINVLSDGFSQINAFQLIALQSVLDSARFGTFAPGGGVFAIEGFTNLSISAAATGSGNGTIRVANSTDWTTGYAFYPSSSTTYAGDIFVNNTHPSVSLPEPGTYGWHMMLHEVGHALGLKHGDEGSYTLPTGVDSLEYSVVSQKSFVGDTDYPYNNSAYSYPQTFMQLDILALQTMYGANYNTNSTNTTYTWSTSDGTMSINGQVALDPGGGGTGNKIFATIWDGNGVDTYDLSNFTTQLTIDLAPGAFSKIDLDRLAVLNNSTNLKAIGNVANALLFNGDTRSLIENANGGSANDTIKGNQASNTLQGNGGHDTLYGYDGADILLGDNGNDMLDGGTGIDLLFGGAGNDTYYVDNFYEVVSETTGNGTDKMFSSVSYDFTSGMDIENAELTGSAGNYLYGNAISQTLLGNSGNNRLDGRAGNDTLYGGGGVDTFVFTTAPTATNIDEILDFAAAQDKIELSRAVFTTLNAGSWLNASAFRIGSAALDADDRVVYNNTSGGLFYDSDGNGAALQIQFATLDPSLPMTSANFTIVA